jgi:hypothetical protein
MPDPKNPYRPYSIAEERHNQRYDALQKEKRERDDYWQTELLKSSAELAKPRPLVRPQGAKPPAIRPPLFVSRDRPAVSGQTRVTAPKRPGVVGNLVDWLLAHWPLSSIARLGDRLIAPPSVVRIAFAGAGIVLAVAATLDSGASTDGGVLAAGGVGAVAGWFFPHLLGTVLKAVAGFMAIVLGLAFLAVVGTVVVLIAVWSLRAIGVT